MGADAKKSQKRRQREKRRSLSSAQEVSYSREFKMADRAGGYVDDRD